MHRCEDCKIILDNDVRFCPKCGKDVIAASSPGDKDLTPTLSSKERENREPIMNVKKLLAAAELHKSRQEWDEAIASATDALRMEPKNAKIAVTLGSIYEEQEMFDEAKVWYQMALELDPKCGPAQAGRDRIPLLVSARRKAAAAAPKGWTRQTKLIAAGMGAVVLLVVVLVLVFSAGGRQRQSPTTAAKANPSINTPLSRPTGSRPSVAAPGPASEPLSGAAVPAGPGKTSGLRTAAENGIKSGIESDDAVTAAGATVDDVIADPRNGVATVTFTVSIKGMITREQISRAAVAVVKKAFGSNQYVKFVTARCLIQAPGSEGSQIAFVGDIARESAAGSDEQIAGAFAHPWWNPQIASNQTPGM